MQLAGFKSFLQQFKKLAAEQARQYPHRKKESGPTRDPAVAFRRKPSSCNDTMEMWMKKQILTPGMEDSEKTNFGTEMFGVGSNGAHGLGYRLEENAVDYFLVLVTEGGNLFRHGKDHVEILAVKKLGLTFLNPFCASQTLAFITMPIAAAVVRIVLVAAAVALFDMAAKGCSPAQLDGTHDASLCG
jgi:hypothetical protein